MRIIADPHDYDTNRVFQLDLSADEFGIIRYALAQLSEAPLVGRDTQLEAEMLSEKVEALAKTFTAGNWP